jgi:hypothetical protein
VRSKLALLFLVACGCAGVSRPRPVQSAAGTLEQVRASKEGVCAGIGTIPGEPWSSDPRAEPKHPLGSSVVGASAQACARALPGQAEGEGGVLDVTLSFPIHDERWRTENWHLEVIRKDGLVIQAGALGAGRLAAGGCLLDTCIQEAHVTVQLSEPWRAGSYRVKLRHVPTRTSVDLTIALE